MESAATPRSILALLSALLPLAGFWIFSTQPDLIRIIAAFAAAGVSGLLLLFAYSRGEQALFRPSLVSAASTLYAGSVLLSALCAASPSFSVLATRFEARGVLAALLFAGLVPLSAAVFRGSNAARLLASAVVAGVALAACIETVRFVMGNVDGRFLLVGSPTDAALVAGSTVFLSLFLARGRGAVRWSGCFGLAVSLIASLLLASRPLLISLAVLLFLLSTYLFRRVSLARLLPLLACTALVCVSAFSYNLLDSARSTVMPVLRGNDPYTSHKGVVVAHQVFAESRLRALLGSGPGTFPREALLASPPPAGDAAAASSDYGLFQRLAETGFVGVFAFLLLYTVFCFFGVRTLIAAPSVSFLFLFASALFLGAGVLLGTGAAPLFLLALLMGACEGMRQLPVPPHVPQPARLYALYARAGSFALLVLFAVALCLFARDSIAAAYYEKALRSAGDTYAVPYARIAALLSPNPAAARLYASLARADAEREIAAPDQTLSAAALRDRLITDGGIAQTYAKRAADEDPGDYRNPLELARALLLHDRLYGGNSWTTIVPLLTEAVARDPLDEQLLLEAARIARSCGAEDDARAFATKVFLSTNSSPEADAFLAPQK